VTRHPRKLVAIWALLVVLLALNGAGLDDDVTTRSPVVEGSAAQRGQAISVREFGRENTLVVLLRGPRAEVERQGRGLERELAGLSGATVISPWDRGRSIDGLMPEPGVAAIVLSLGAAGEDPTTALPPVRKRIDATISSPVRASVTGPPALADSFASATREAAAAGELIAAPLLLLVLLLVFRSVVAAAVPVLVGGAVVAATRGVLDLLLPFTAVEFLALAAVGMMGLALGVDYSLLMVSRFREETRKGADPALATQRTLAATGPTVVMAGAGLSLAMAASSFLLPGSLVTSVAIAVIAAAGLSVLSALLVTPAILVLLGPRLERWTLPSARARHGSGPRWTGRLSRRPHGVVWPVIALLVAAALWAGTLDTEMEGIGLLPAGDSGRQQHEDIQQALGPGWGAPYEIVMDGGDRPVTTPNRLRALADFERRVERDPGIATMTGFTAIERANRRLEGAGNRLLAQQRGLGRLDRGLSRAHEGAALNTDGLFRAAEGARQLDTAIGATEAGAGLLAEGLHSAGTGSERLAAGVARSEGGSDRVASGTAKASAGARRLSTGLARARDETGKIAESARVLRSALASGDRSLAEAEASVQATESELATTLTALRAMTVGRDDPQYQAALAAAERASAASTATEAEAEEARGQFSLGLYLTDRLKKSGRQASDGAARLSAGAARLDRALDRLAMGSRRLTEGVARLLAGGEQLSPALSRLAAGAESLAQGLGRVQGGAGSLARGLGGGAQESRLLTVGLNRIDAAVERQLGESAGAASPAALAKELPRLLRSGYLPLAALDTRAPESRRQAGLLVSLDGGGHAARMVVIPRDDPADDAARDTRARLEDEAGRLARSTDATVVVGGAAAELQDLNDAFRDQAGPARLALALITILILVPVMRSLTIPLIAAVLNVLTVAATFGFLALLFDGSLLGGPGYVDATVIPATIVVIFGLAIDYEVFIFARIREEYERTGSAEIALTKGLERTAPVVTGAALIMLVVFLSFATSSFSTIRNFGVAQAIAVAIDAFVIRLVVIPAVMRVMGRWAWWLPRWLDRLLPSPRRPV
jgi:RND superfamily putative drug exporter